LPTVVFFESFGEDILELVEGELLDALVAVAAILGGDVDVASTESLKGRSLRAVFASHLLTTPYPFLLFSDWWRQRWNFGSFLISIARKHVSDTATKREEY
jgi:hypothetical protein